MCSRCELAVSARWCCQVEAAKRETSEALVNLERERHKLSMLEVEVGGRKGEGLTDAWCTVHSIA